MKYEKRDSVKQAVFGCCWKSNEHCGRLRRKHRDCVAHKGRYEGTTSTTKDLLGSFAGGMN